MNDANCIYLCPWPIACQETARQSAPPLNSKNEKLPYSHTESTPSTHVALESSIYLQLLQRPMGILRKTEIVPRAKAGRLITLVYQSASMFHISLSENAKTPSNT